MSTIQNPLTRKDVQKGGVTYHRLIAEGFELSKSGKRLVPKDGYKIYTDGKKRWIAVDDTELPKSPDQEELKRQEQEKLEREKQEQERARVLKEQQELEKKRNDIANQERGQKARQALAMLLGDRVPQITRDTQLEKEKQEEEKKRWDAFLKSPAIDDEDRIVGSASVTKTEFRHVKGIEIDLREHAEGNSSVSPKPIKKLNISPTELLKIIQGPDGDKFIADVRKSLTELYEWKKENYKSKRRALEQQIYDIKTKIDDMQATMGQMNARDIKDAFPMFSTLILNRTFLKQVVRKVEETDKITTDELKQRYIDAITHPKKGILSLRGTSRKEIRSMLATQLYSLKMGYEAFADSFLNIIVMGPAGVGKTTLANVMAYVYNKSGILATQNIVTVTRAQLIGQYIGHTAPLVNKVLFNTLEGILFIDEAYQLTPKIERGDRGDPFSSEAITELVNFLDKFVGLSVVIAAGYEKEMKTQFLTANEGMPRRFPFKILLTSYSTADLTEIFIGFLNSRFKQDVLDPEEKNYMFTIIDTLYTKNPAVFSNQAGDILNLASFLIRRILSSYQVTWKRGDIRNNSVIIMAAVSDYLESKGMTLVKPK